MTNSSSNNNNGNNNNASAISSFRASTFETSALAAAGYSGFIPNIKYEIGKSYGNATREILERDRVFASRRAQLQAAAAARDRKLRGNDDSDYYNYGNGNGDGNGSGGINISTGDERFSNALVAGYTGYVPRLQEHFGRGYVDTTVEALNDFNATLKKRDQLPPKLAKLYAKARKNQAATAANNANSNTANANASSSNEESGNTTSLPLLGPPSAESFITRNFMSGYTGYIPQLNNHFGKSVRRTLEDGDIVTPQISHQQIIERNRRENFLQSKEAKPIPGFTGHIPGSKYRYATTYGKLPFSIPKGQQQENEEDEYFKRNLDITGTSEKNLCKNQPISGYMGHIQGYAFTAEKPYRNSTKVCLEKYAHSKLENSNAAAANAAQYQNNTAAIQQA